MLEPVSRGWPTCLQAVVATALLVEEAGKVTLGGELEVYTPHHMRGVSQQKADEWITDVRLLKDEGILIHSPKLELETTGLQNPAQFLYGEPSEEWTHDCVRLIEPQTKIREDLEEEELPNGEKLFVDRSLRVINGKQKSGHAIIDGNTSEVKEVEKLQQMGIVEKEGKWALPDGREVIPEGMAWRMMKEIHRQTHWGVQALVDHFGTKYVYWDL